MKRKRAGILTKIIIAALLVYSIWMLADLHGRVREAENTRDELLQVEAALTAENSELRYAIDHKDDDSVMEDIARDEGYIFQNEEVYYAE